MENERRLEILGILTIALSVFVLVSLSGYNPSEEPSISSNVQVTNPMGILGIFTSHLFIKLGFGFSTLFIPCSLHFLAKSSEFSLLIFLPSVCLLLQCLEWNGWT